METLSSHLWLPHLQFSFLSYLWGMETGIVYASSSYVNNPVLILPMRNGNKVWSYQVLLNSRSYPTYEEWKHISLIKKGLSFASSYPTYEEWKHFTLNVLYQSFSVLILPMRNGNNELRIEVAKQKEVLILPMRNGNFITFKANKLWRFSVLILPMRNGNNLLLWWFLKLDSSSVLILPMRNGNTKITSERSDEKWLRSYPTYEEWKQAYKKEVWEWRLSSYPTYEEWKRWIAFRISSINAKFLSYLWGMETMNIIFDENLLTGFLSYLWGMETKFHSLF